eukprot:6208464-Pleurochrysis_carterae.AAC.2
MMLDLRKGVDAVPEKAEQFNTLVDALYATDPYWRSVAAAASQQIPSYNDDSNGAAFERREMMRKFKEVGNNVITLSGDVHDSRAEILFEDGMVEGTPQAVHFTAGGVTAAFAGGDVSAVRKVQSPRKQKLAPYD